MQNKKASFLQSVKLCMYLFNCQIKFYSGEEQITEELSGMGMTSAMFALQKKGQGKANFNITIK